MEAVMVSETVLIPQELKILKDAIVDVAQKLHDGASMASLVGSELGALEQAIVNAGELPADLKSEQMPVAMGLLAGQLTAALLKPKAAVAAAAPSA